MHDDTETPPALTLDGLLARQREIYKRYLTVCQELRTIEWQIKLASKAHPALGPTLHEKLLT